MEPSTYLIDEDDDLDLIDMDAVSLPRERREAMVEAGLQMLRDHNYEICDWLLVLCEDYIDGKITFAQLNRGVMRTQLH